ncbi:hypothetical protein ACFL3J_01340 [Candidatus Omnitrophota bacterium]
MNYLWYFVLGAVLLWLCFFIIAGIIDKKRKKMRKQKHEDRPRFRTEENVEEYGKPMDPQPVDFDDAEWD